MDHLNKIADEEYQENLKEASDLEKSQHDQDEKALKDA